MPDRRLSYTPRADATPAAELAAIAAVYRFIIDSYAKKIAAGPDICNDPAKERNIEGGEPPRAVTR